MATLPSPPDPAPTNPITPHRTPRARRRWVLLALVVLAAGGAAAQWYRVTRPVYRLERGREAARVGDWGAAEGYARRLDAAGHGDHARMLRGEVYRQRGRPDLTVREVAGVNPDGPFRHDAAALGGRALLDLGRPAEAYPALALVARENPDHVEAHRGLAVIAYDLGQLDAAVSHLTHVARLDPADARPHRLIGLVRKDMGQLPAAEEAYREALQRGLPARTRAEVRTELADVLTRQARFADGLAVLDEGDRGRPGDDPTAVAARAECLRGLGRPAEAADLLDRALAARPAATLYRVRGQLDLDGGAAADAVRRLERATELAPADHQAYYLLAQAYTGVGRAEDAARAAARADELKKAYDHVTGLTAEAMARPWDAGVRLQLAESFDRLGRPDLAGMWRAAAAACTTAEPEPSPPTDRSE